MKTPVTAVAQTCNPDHPWEEPLPEIPMDRGVLVAPFLLLLCIALAVGFLLLGGDP